MVYRITVAFNLKKGKDEYRYTATGLYFQCEEIKPLSKKELTELAKTKALDLAIKNYPKHRLTSEMKVTVKQMHVNFIL
ncbi:MAG: hypothetical protein RBT57_02910 [Paludibacter sp.]|jgi:hypothetical protein|nr:hypothetical protein [Paludibacter sp.]